MKNTILNLIHLFWFSLFFFTGSAQNSESSSKKIKVFVIASNDKNHSPMIKKAEPMFKKMAEQNNFEIHFTRDTAEINSLNLSNYQVFVQLSIAYFDFSRTQQFAIQQFISSGRGWIGIHGAGLIGSQFAAKDGRDWKWFWHLLGDAYYSPHPPLQEGVLKIENATHPVTKNLPASFSLRDEWYEFKNVPSNATVLAVANESTYKPKNPMGYHPVIWTNPAFNRVLYISVGHDSTSCKNESYNILLRDAIKWAGDNEGLEQKKKDAFPQSEASILINQPYNNTGTKRAMFKSKFPFAEESAFTIIDAMTLEQVYTGKIKKSEQVKKRGIYSCPIDFSDFVKPGFYKIQVTINEKQYNSLDFEIGSRSK